MPRKAKQIMKSNIIESTKTYYHKKHESRFSERVANLQRAQLGLDIEENPELARNGKVPEEKTTLSIDLVQTLSDKEKRIYELLCANLSNEEIAQETELSVRGVVYHLTHIYAKLGVSSEDKTDLHLCRQRAISYSGTKIEQSVGRESGVYTREDILKASKRLSWQDSIRVQEIVTDLLQMLDTNGDWTKLTTGVSKGQYNGCNGRNALYRNS